METCKTCRYWQLNHPEYIPTWNHYELLGQYRVQPDTQGRTLVLKSEQQAIADTGYATRWCTKFLSNGDRPERNGVSLFGEFDDGSAMATGEDFGCIHYQAIA